MAQNVGLLGVHEEHVRMSCECAAWGEKTSFDIFASYRLENLCNKKTYNTVVVTHFRIRRDCFYLAHALIRFPEWPPTRSCLRNCRTTHVQYPSRSKYLLFRRLKTETTAPKRHLRLRMSKTWI